MRSWLSGHRFVGGEQLCCASFVLYIYITIITIIIFNFSSFSASKQFLSERKCSTLLFFFILILSPAGNSSVALSCPLDKQHFQNSRLCQLLFMSCFYILQNSLRCSVSTLTLIWQLFLLAAPASPRRLQFIVCLCGFRTTSLIFYSSELQIFCSISVNSLSSKHIVLIF